MLRKRSYVVKKVSLRSQGLGGSYQWENFYLGFRELGHKDRDLGSRSSRRLVMWTHRNHLRRKEWRGKISETEPARLTRLIRRGPKYWAFLEQCHAIPVASLISKVLRRFRKGHDPLLSPFNICINISPHCSQGLPSHILIGGGGGGGGGGTPRKLGGGVRPSSQNPYPIYDQNLRYSLPYLWPGQIFETLFMTRPLHQNPVSDLHYN